MKIIFYFYYTVYVRLYEKTFENTKGVIISRKSNSDNRMAKKTN